MVWWIILLISTLLFAHYIYYRFSRFRKKVVFRDKQIITKGTIQEYVAYDEKNVRYMINSCFWAGKLSPHNEWEKIVEGKTYIVEGYGVPLPFVERYPCIFCVKLVQIKSSATT